MEITTVGLDLAKNVFQVHAIGSTGEVVVRRALRRAQVVPFFSRLPPCLVGMEACGTSHHWARELTRLGHEVRLMPPAYVKPYVKRGQDRCCGCGGDLRGGHPPHHALRADQVGRAAGRAGAASDARSPRPPAHPARQHDPGLLAEFGIDIPKGITHALAFVRRAVADEASEVRISPPR
jgi:transposase